MSQQQTSKCRKSIVLSIRLTLHIAIDDSSHIRATSDFGRVLPAIVASKLGIQAGGTIGVVARKNGATTDKAPCAVEKASCGAATGVTKSGGTGATAACNATVAGQDAAPAGCLAE